jgi:hypothetical protein
MPGFKLSLAVPCCLPAFGQVIGVNNFIHSVSDLDKTTAFSLDTLGLELKTAPPVQWC